GLAQIEPRLLTWLGRTIDGDLVMRSQRRHSFPGPAITTTRGQLVAIENAGDQFIIGDRDKLSNGGDDILRCAVALPTSTSGQAQLRVNPTHPVEEQDDLSGLAVDVRVHILAH